MFHGRVFAYNKRQGSAEVLLLLLLLLVLFSPFFPFFFFFSSIFFLVFCCSILFRKTSAHILCARRFSFTSLAEE